MTGSGSLFGDKDDGKLYLLDRSVSSIRRLQPIREEVVVAARRLSCGVDMQGDPSLLSLNLGGQFISESGFQLLAMALENKDKLLARSQKITRDNLAILADWVTEQPRVSWVKPNAGTTAMLQVDVPMTSREFCVDLLQKTGVMSP